MSWSTRTPDAVAKDAVALDEPQLSDAVEVEQRTQFEAAVEAAKVLAQAVGREGDRVIVSLSGHANPDHAPREGWGTECVTVAVYVVPASTDA